MNGIGGWHVAGAGAALDDPCLVAATKLGEDRQRLREGRGGRHDREIWRRDDLGSIDDGAGCTPKFRDQGCGSAPVPRISPLSSGLRRPSLEVHQEECGTVSRHIDTRQAEATIHWSLHRMRRWASVM